MASKRRLRRKQCEGKRKHATADNALVEIRRIRKLHGHCGQIGVYICPFCHSYHVGHVPGMNGIGSGYRGWNR